MADAEEATGSERIDLVNWFRRPRGLADGVLNTSFNALDRHIIAGRADRGALVFHSAVTGRRRTYSYAELLEKVAQLGGSLTAMGVRAGDPVLISLPPVPEVMIAMLACARIGAVHHVVTPVLSPTELGDRIDEAEPVVIIAASCALEDDQVIACKPLLDSALQRSSHQPQYCVILQRPELGADMQAPRDLDFGLLMRPGSVEPATCVDRASTDPLYVEGGLVHDNGPRATDLAWSLPNDYGIGPDDVILVVTDVASALGHSMIVYGPLLTGATTVLYEGDRSDLGAIGRAVTQEHVDVLLADAATIAGLGDGGPDVTGVRMVDVSHEPGVSGGLSP